MSAPGPRSQPEALPTVYRRVAPGLYRLALAITGDPALAEDVVQEAFVRVMGRGEGVERDRPLDGYLYRTGRNVALDHVRRRRHDEAARRALLVAPKPGRRGGAGAEVDAERVSAALFALPVEQREVVVLRVYEGLTFREVSERTGVPLGTVCSRYRYALQHLRPLLETTNAS